MQENRDWYNNMPKRADATENEELWFEICTARMEIMNMIGRFFSGKEAAREIFGTEKYEPLVCRIINWNDSGTYKNAGDEKSCKALMSCKKELNILYGHNKIKSVVDVKEVVSEKKANKTYSLDIATFEIMKEKILGENVELALAEYVKKEHDVITERKALPLEKLKRNVNLTMSVSFFRLLKKLAAGRRVESAIIEVSLWQYYGGKK